MKNKYEYNGKSMFLAELMEFSVVGKGALTSRIKGGWLLEEALKTPLGQPRKINLSKYNIDKDVKRHNKNVSMGHNKIVRNGSEYDIRARVVGEINLTLIPQDKKSPLKTRIAKNKKVIETKCDSCGKIIMKSHTQVRDYGHLVNKCLSCRTEEKKELNAAMINLARRKGLIK